MTIDKDDLINSIMASIDRIHNVKAEEFPNIDLYMDQVTTFIEERLKASVRNPGDDKVLTKTMINNYAKNNLLPPPVKKKYNKEHLALLIFIYYSKNIMSIQDIQSMLGPLTERYYGKDGDINICSIFDAVFDIEDERIEELKSDIMHKYELSQDTFLDANGEDKDILQLFSFIFMLGYDVYVKKLLIEKLLDTFAKEATPSAETSANTKKGKKKNV